MVRGKEFFFVAAKAPTQTCKHFLDNLLFAKTEYSFRLILFYFSVKRRIHKIKQQRYQSEAPFDDIKIKTRYQTSQAYTAGSSIIQQLLISSNFIYFDLSTHEYANILIGES